VTTLAHRCPRYLLRRCSVSAVSNGQGALPGHRPVSLGEGVAVLVPVAMTVEVAGMEVRVVADMVDGRLACTELHVSQREGGPPVTTDAIRLIPVAQLVKAAAASYVMQTSTPSPGVTWGSPPVVPEGFPKAGPTDDALRFVALVYRTSHAFGDPPTMAVESLGLPRSTAIRWVSLARRKGFLGTTTPGRAGEKVDDGSR